MIECRKCGDELVVDENWWPSYAKRNSRICIECQKAYQRQWQKDNPDYEKPLIICKECGEEKPHAAHGLCAVCYTRQWHEQNPDHDYERPLIICQECGEEKPHMAHGLCNTCYKRQYERPLIICKECGEKRPHYAHGLCSACYQRQRERPIITCKECGEERPHAGRGLCKTCYDRQYRKDNPDKNRAGVKRYRARKANAPVNDFTAEDWQAVLDHYDHKCAYCGATDDIEQDHIIPLSHNGLHTISNIVPACRSCNASKGAKTPSEAKMFLKILPLLST